MPPRRLTPWSSGGVRLQGLVVPTRCRLRPGPGQRKKGKPPKRRVLPRWARIIWTAHTSTWTPTMASAMMIGVHVLVCTVQMIRAYRGKTLRFGGFPFFR